MLQRLVVSASLVWLAACGEASQDLTSEDQIKGDSLPTALTSTPGNAAAGQQVFADRDRGHCVLCHQVEGLDVPFQGNVGPDLTFVGDRLSPGQLRLRVVNIETVVPGSVMPSYYRISGLNQVLDTYEGNPILNGQEVEDLVAFMASLNLSETRHVD